jgi:hypothetical protein
VREKNHDSLYQLTRQLLEQGVEVDELAKGFAKAVTDHYGVLQRRQGLTAVNTDAFGNVVLGAQ